MGYKHVLSVFCCCGRFWGLSAPDAQSPVPNPIMRARDGQFALLLIAACARGTWAEGGFDGDFWIAALAF
jgi:hypothetical protein